MYSNFAALHSQEQHLSHRLNERGTESYYHHHQKHTPPLSEPRNRFLFYFQHGTLWSQDLSELQHDTETYKFSAAASKAEIQRLSDKLQAQQDSNKSSDNGVTHRRPSASDKDASRDTVAVAPVASPLSPSSSAPRFLQLRNLLFDDDNATARLDIRASDYDFWPCCEEIALVFQSLPRTEAVKVLSVLMEKAAGLALPRLGETYAVCVDLLSDKERRQFLREYFLLVSSGELQDALLERDECNDEKRWQMLIDELKERLGLGVSDDERDGVDDAARQSSLGQSHARTDAAKSAAAAKRLARFHSDEAKVGAKVLEMAELLEDVAAEVSFLDAAQSGLSAELLKKLREYEDADKRLAKARELMLKADRNGPRLQPQFVHRPREETRECACHCGNHRLVHKDDVASPRELIEEDGRDDAESAEKSAKAKTSRRSTTLKRPLSARRKNAVSFGTRLASQRGSTTQLRLFPLAEVCHILSAILHLKFSRDATGNAVVGGTSSNGSRKRDGQAQCDAAVSMLEDQWSFLRSSKPTFKTLAKDYLTRKYGIKSIAVMHTLQLERSLVYYSAMEKHVRCELFAWFFGADKLRLASKEYAFQFFQRLMKSIMSLFLAKRPASAPAAAAPLSLTSQQQLLPQPPLSFAALISVWTEYIGDGEVSSASTFSSTSAAAANALVRYLVPSQAIDACTLTFPMRMKEAPEYASFVERLYRLGLERGQVELESFLKSVMELWLAIFDRLAAELHVVLGDNAGGEFEFDAFTAAVARTGMELTGGERLEIFDLLSQENDESVVSRTKLLWFLLEAKYLRVSS